MSAQESQEVVSAPAQGTVSTSKEWPSPRVYPGEFSVGISRPLSPTGSVHAHNVQINGGNFTSIGRDVHNHTHIHEATKHKEKEFDLTAALKSIDNHRRIQQDTLSKATPKTGEWIFNLEKFPAWWDPQGGVKAIWGTGDPGAGKTVLTSIVINSFEKRANEIAICVGYIYIRYSDIAGLTVRHCLEILVKQTTEKHPECFKLAEVVYAEHSKLKTRPTEEELLQLLKGFTSKVLATFYFLDAVDEAPERIQLDLLNRLSSLNVKLFITSRPLATLQERYPHAHHFLITAQDADLELHINNELDTGGQQLWKVLEQGGPELRADIKASIKQNCGGMFLHASLQLAALQHCTTVYDVRETLSSFPPKIEDVYRDTWARIVAQASNKGVRAQNCLFWVLNSPRSIRVTELQHAAAVCLETRMYEPSRVMHKDTLLSCCRGLLVVDKQTALVRLVHYTAKEILEGLIIETYPRLHSLMASICTGRLFDRGLHHWQWKYKRYSLEHTMEDDPLLRYVYHTWAIHARNALNDPSAAIEVKAFVQSCLSFPLEAADGRSYFELLSPLHVVAAFDLPISLTGHPWMNALHPNPRTERYYNTPLHLACRRASHSTCSTIQELLSLRLIDVNAVNSRSQTPLMEASMSGNMHAVKLLLAHPNIRLDLVDWEGLTVFRWAVKRGNEAVVTAILSHSQAEIHSTDQKGQTPLSLACDQGQFAMVKLLLSHSKLEVYLADNYGKTPLIYAVESNFIDIVRLLLEVTTILGHSQAKIHSTDQAGQTPLSLACEHGQIAMVKLLLSHSKAEVHLADNYGNTPLIYAVGSNCIDIVRLLLADPHIDINSADATGWTPLFWTARSHKRVEVMKVLLAHPQTNVNILDHEGCTPLMLAAGCDHLGPLTLLLDHPATDVNLSDKEGHSALHWASTSGRNNAVRLLLSHSEININVQDDKGRTPLLVASGACEQGAVNLLLADPRVDVNLADRDGRTPLICLAMQKRYAHWFSASSHRAIAQLLLAHPKTNVNLADNKGRTALTWASKRGHKEFVNLLLLHPQIQVLGRLLDSSVYSARHLCHSFGRNGMMSMS